MGRLLASNLLPPPSPLYLPFSHADTHHNALYTQVEKYPDNLFVLEAVAELHLPELPRVNALTCSVYNETPAGWALWGLEQDRIEMSASGEFIPAEKGNSNRGFVSTQRGRFFDEMSSVGAGGELRAMWLRSLDDAGAGVEDDDAMEEDVPKDDDDDDNVLNLSDRFSEEATLRDGGELTFGDGGELPSSSSFMTPSSRVIPRVGSGNDFIEHLENAPTPEVRERMQRVMHQQ